MLDQTIASLVPPGMNLSGKAPPFDLYAEATVAQNGGTTLSESDSAMFHKIISAYTKTGGNDPVAHREFINTLTNNGHGVSDIVLQRVLYNAAHGMKEGLAADVLAYYPHAKSLTFRTPQQYGVAPEIVTFEQLITKQRILGDSDRSIPQWNANQILELQQKIAKVEATHPHTIKEQIGRSY